MAIDRRRLATALWIVWAAIVWNVVFDRVLVVAGRQYVRSARAAAGGSGPYARIDDAMRPAVSRAFWTASASAGVIVAIGFAAVRLAPRTPRQMSPAGTPWAPPPTR